LVIFHHFFFKKIDQYGYDAPTNHDVLLIILCLNRLKINTKLIFWCISEKFYSICNKIYNNSYFYQKRHLKTRWVFIKNCINVYIFLTFLVNLRSIFLKIIDLFSNFLKKMAVCIIFIIFKKNSCFLIKIHQKLMKKYMKWIYLLNFFGQFEVALSKNHRFVCEFLEKIVDFDNFYKKYWFFMIFDQKIPPK
jgi:hypothetical protein